MNIEIEVIDNHDKPEFLKAQCANGHIFGDGKNVYFEELCPECGAEITGTHQRKIMKIDTEEFRGLFGSIGK